MPVMAKRCKTCPFNADGDSELRERIMARLFKVSQTCHTTGVALGKQDTHLCRGARDWQNEMLFRLGFLEAPTDAAWAAKRKQCGI